MDSLANTPLQALTTIHSLQNEDKLAHKAITNLDKERSTAKTNLSIARRRLEHYQKSEKKATDRLDALAAKCDDYPNLLDEKLFKIRQVGSAFDANISGLLIQRKLASYSVQKAG